MRHDGWKWAAVVLVAGLVGATPGACGGDDGDDDEDAATTTTAALAYRAEITGEHELDGNFRQGLGRHGDGWVIATNKTLYRTDGSFTQTAKADNAIPPDLVAQTYDHLGDPDVADGVLWVPIEQPSRSDGQVIARYDPDTLAYVGSHSVDQAHASFVAADGDVVYSMNEFDGDDAVLRYRWDGETLEPIEPLRMDRTLERVQGGDVADGALWLSTDDDRNGVYRVDLETGEVDDLGSAGRVEGEGEGIDATDLPSGLLHVLIADPEIVPMWVVDMAVTSAPE
jgi:hypothetical protein